MWFLMHCKACAPTNYGCARSEASFSSERIIFVVSRISLLKLFSGIFNCLKLKCVFKCQNSKHLIVEGLNCQTTHICQQAVTPPPLIPFFDFFAASALMTFNSKGSFLLRKKFSIEWTVNLQNLKFRLEAIFVTSFDR